MSEFKMSHCPCCGASLWNEQGYDRCLLCSYTTKPALEVPRIDITASSDVFPIGLPIRKGIDYPGPLGGGKP